MSYLIGFLGFAMILLMLCLMGAFQPGKTDDEKMKRLQNGLVRRAMRGPK